MLLLVTSILLDILKTKLNVEWHVFLQDQKKYTGCPKNNVSGREIVTHILKRPFLGHKACKANDLPVILFTHTKIFKLLLRIF